MNWLFRLLWAIWGQHVLMREMKRKSLAAYLRAVRAARLSLIVVLLAGLILQAMLLAGFGAVVTGFLLWDYEFAAKIEILFWIFTSMFLIPFVLLLILLSERLWLRLSGAKRMMENLK